MLYALGSNGSGQLGLGHTRDVSDPQQITIVGNNPPWKVEQLAAGGSHTVILCDDGTVRVTGDNQDGRCGIPIINQITHFTDIPLPRDEDSGQQIEIVQVAASWESTLLLGSNGNVYVCGTGQNGQLGLGPELASSTCLQQIPSFPASGAKIVSISSGLAHTVALCSNGELYGWGKGRNGQLGGEADVVWQPRKIDGIDFRPAQIACGKDFTIVMGDPESGRIAVLGGTRNDKFGIKADAPMSFPNLQTIAASWGSGYALTKKGEIVAWGRNDKGQHPPPGLAKIKTLAAGSEHCIALMEDGTVATWGWGEHGNCGSPVDNRGDVKGCYNVLSAPGGGSKVFAGCATSFIETTESSTE